MFSASTVKYITLSLAILSMVMAIKHLYCQNKDCSQNNLTLNWIGAAISILVFTSISLLRPGRQSFVSNRWLQPVIKYILPLIALITGMTHAGLVGSSINGDQPNETLLYLTLVGSVLVSGLFGYDIFRSKDMFAII